MIKARRPTKKIIADLPTAPQATSLLGYSRQMKTNSAHDVAQFISQESRLANSLLRNPDNCVQVARRSGIRLPATTLKGPKLFVAKSRSLRNVKLLLLQCLGVGKSSLVNSKLAPTVAYRPAGERTPQLSILTEEQDIDTFNHVYDVGMVQSNGFPALIVPTYFHENCTPVEMPHVGPTIRYFKPSYRPRTIDQIRADIVHNPNDQALRLEFADKLIAERQVKQASFVKRQIHIDENWMPALSEREIIENIEMERDFGKAWSGFMEFELPPSITWKYRRGLVEHLICPADFLSDRRFTRLIELAPIRHLTLRLSSGLVRLDARALNRISSISLDAMNFKDRDLEAICSQEWQHLDWLSLSNNSITSAGVERLALATAEKQFPRLRYVGLLGRTFDPRERLLYDQGVHTESEMPEDAIQLEARYGRIPWLHLTNSGKLLPVNRYELAEDRTPRE